MRFLPARAQNEARSLPREMPRSGLAQAATRASDYDDFALDALAHEFRDPS
jgi:hypothetical protein